ncbi:MAG TPA: L,D-transpeptidase [Gemmataceae bacterium]|nr:L,D-transpeptidase [Gemmataceae bacterium]
MLHSAKAALLGAAVALVSIAPSFAAPNLFGPPPGMSFTTGRPTNGLMLRGPRVVHLDPKFMRQVVPYTSREAAGTLVVDTGDHFLYLVLGGGKALRYGIGTAKTGFEWNGTHHITNKREWPDWTPPAEMLARRPDIPHHMDGGINNPLGARALYIGSTLYRIHGTNEPWTIGGDVSSGCIRMINDDVIDLYGRVTIGAKVIVL